MYKKLVSYFLEKYSLKNNNLNNTKIKQYSTILIPICNGCNCNFMTPLSKKYSLILHQIYIIYASA